MPTRGGTHTSTRGGAARGNVDNTVTHGSGGNTTPAPAASTGGAPRNPFLYGADYLRRHYGHGNWDPTQIGSGQLFPTDANGFPIGPGGITYTGAQHEWGGGTTAIADAFRNAGLTEDDYARWLVQGEQARRRMSNTPAAPGQDIFGNQIGANPNFLANLNARRAQLGMPPISPAAPHTTPGNSGAGDLNPGGGVLPNPGPTPPPAVDNFAVPSPTSPAPQATPAPTPATAPAATTGAPSPFAYRKPAPASAPAQTAAPAPAPNPSSVTPAPPKPEDALTTTMLRPRPPRTSMMYTRTPGEKQMTSPFATGAATGQNPFGIQRPSFTGGPRVSLQGPSLSGSY